MAEENGRAGAAVPGLLPSLLAARVLAASPAPATATATAATPTAVATPPTVTAPTVPAPPRSTKQVMLLQMLAGAGSGSITKTAVAPLERLKILFQIQGMVEGAPKKYTGVVQALGVVGREEGLVGFYKGNGANVLRVIPVYALKFAFNDTFKDMVRGGDVGPLGPQKLMLAGTMAGMMQQLVTYPLEVVRTRLSLGVTMGLHYNGITDCVKQILAKEGPAGLYKGMGPTLISGAPYVGLQMTMYSMLRRMAPVDSEGITPLQWSILAGAGAGLMAQTITFPGDVIRRRMQTNGAGGVPKIYRNSWHCTVVTVQKEGWTALYKGLSTNIIRCLPGAGIQFAAYDALKRALGVHEVHLHGRSE
uniref:ADP,ATP carrier protein n=1 Tax=Bicosoecida sp. CB-2014 TaxID=1486930 RepID=A0A7S1CEW4_9STRA